MDTFFHRFFHIAFPTVAHKCYGKTLQEQTKQKLLRRKFLKKLWSITNFSADTTARAFANAKTKVLANNRAKSFAKTKAKVFINITVKVSTNITAKVFANITAKVFLNITAKVLGNIVVSLPKHRGKSLLKKLRQKFGLPRYSGRSLWKLHAKARYLAAEVNITLRDRGLLKS